MEAQQIIITGISTDVGKTVVSAIVAEALKASYWKPVQAGDLDNSDSIKVNNYTSNVSVLAERFKLSQPMSPHAAAFIDDVVIGRNDFQLPQVSGNLIVEGAGGIMVPLNSTGLTFTDVISDWNLPTIVVSRHYLGSINHTLLTIEVLKSKGVKIAGIIFVGDENKATEEIILSNANVKMITRIPMTKEINKAFILEQSKNTALLEFFNL